MMLTKDLLQYRVRSGKVTPLLLAPADPEALAAAAELTRLFSESDGKTIGELEAEAQESAAAGYSRFAAFKKLLFDRTDEADDDGQIEARRKEVLTLAQQLRTSTAFATLAEFQAALAAAAKEPAEDLTDRLYSDLPEHRRLRDFKPMTPLALIHRHNVAQVQGLLMSALSLTVTLPQCPLAERRRFFRCLKFQRLLTDATTQSKGDELKLVLSGPLRMFQNTQSYGVRLANFFPHIIQMPSWRIDAELKVGTKELTLSLDQNAGLVSHYREMTPHIPAELTAFIQTFNERGGDWRAAPGLDFLNLGRQSYCFPDVTFAGPKGRTLHLELFHRWHAGQLVGRLAALDLLAKETASGPAEPLLVGIAEELRKDKEIAAALAGSTWFNSHGFDFKSFPTPRPVSQALLRATTALPPQKAVKAPKAKAASGKAAASAAVEAPATLRDFWGEEA